MATLAALRYGDKLGYGGFVVVIVWWYVTPALLLGALVLGITMVDRGKRTSFRMAALGFGLATVALAAVGYPFFT